LGFALLLSLRFVDKVSIINILAGLVTILLIAIIGFLDDIFIVRRIWRLVLPAIAALPLVVVDSGTPEIHLLHHRIYLGPVYTYIMIPLGVIACANFINILAGFNGLEAGSGLIASSSIFIASLILIAFEPGKYSVAAPVIMIAMIGSCLAFLVFNWQPAKIFPGNVGTYVIGASIASAIIIGDMEKIGIVALMPQIMEFLLKARSGFKAGNFGVLVNGTLNYKGKVSSLTHLFMKYLKVSELKLVLYLLGIQIIFAILAVWSVFWYR
jgi:UDP-N-acetylglucosamine--dolichyl-phosphate N-acetylglucosaminephosphotransferase